MSSMLLFPAMLGPTRTLIAPRWMSSSRRLLKFRTCNRVIMWPRANDTLYSPVSASPPILPFLPLTPEDVLGVVASERTSVALRHSQRNAWYQNLLLKRQPRLLKRSPRRFELLRPDGHVVFFDVPDFAHVRPPGSKNPGSFKRLFKRGRGRGGASSAASCVSSLSSWT